MLYFIFNLIFIFVFSLTVFAEGDGIMQQPKNLAEFQHLLKSSMESQPFVYTISLPDRTFLDNKDWKCNRQEISIRQYSTSISYISGVYDNKTKNASGQAIGIFPTADSAGVFFTGYLMIAPLPSFGPGPSDGVFALNRQYEALPTNFLFSKYNKENIGTLSYERKFGIWADDPTRTVFFLRGNCFIQVDTRIAFVYDREAKPDGGQEIKLSKGPDPREIAWKIDQYLKGDPLEKLNGEAKQKLKTLELTLPKDTEFEQGKEYPLDFPRKSLDGTVPAEIRLVVSRGEIQQVIETNAAEGVKTSPNPASLAPDIDGKYTVLFGQPEKQTIRCYHINEEGKCLAWGEIEVLVKKSPKK